MKSIHDLLADHPFFRGFDEATLQLIAGCGQNVHFAPDARISAEGDSADLFYVLRTGKVALEVDDPRKGPQIIETLREGEILGVAWLVPPYRWAFDVRALESTSAIAVDAACLRGKCDDDPELGYEMLKRFAALVRNRLQATRLVLLDFYGSDAG